jgi:hypothetical protein
VALGLGTIVGHSAMSRTTVNTSSKVNGISGSKFSGVAVFLKKKEIITSPPAGRFVTIVLQSDIIGGRKVVEFR